MLLFEVERGASDNAISAVPNQNRRPVAFMSKTIQGSEKGYNIVEKEALAIITAMRKWKYLLS